MSKMETIAAIMDAALMFKTAHPRLKGIEVSRLAKVTKRPYHLCREAVKRLDEDGRGRYVMGRRGYESRIIWSEEPAPYDVEDDETITASAADKAVSDMPLSTLIDRSREIISEAAGVTSDKVSISISF